MFTNNYIAYRRMMFFDETGTFTNVAGTAITAGTSGGRWADLGCAIRFARCSALAVVQASTGASSFDGLKGLYGIYFGSGSTPASKEDYKLESPITAGLQIVNPTFKKTDGVWDVPIEESNGQYSLVSSFTVKNTTESDITIREIGAFVEFNTAGDYYHYFNPVLFKRDVLDEPITIEPGKVKIIDYRLTFNHS